MFITNNNEYSYNNESTIYKKSDYIENDRSANYVNPDQIVFNISNTAQDQFVKSTSGHSSRSSNRT
jgi:hypothetical protein